MTLPEDVPGSRGRRRSHHACLNCRRKKTRCPGEKPACSSCVRLKQQCSYAPVVKGSQSGRSEERLAHLEEKLNLLLNGNLPGHSTNPEQILEAIADHSRDSQSVSPSIRETSQTTNHASTLYPSPEIPNQRPGLSDIAIGIDLYFKYCHRQPIWCFERDEIQDPTSLPQELTSSILAITCRFLHKHDQSQRFVQEAKSRIMFRMTNGTVQLETIESLCLLSYSSFIDGDIHLGQFHVGLALQLCRSAMLDMESSYSDDDPHTERKRRIFWSLQLLEQSYGRQSGLLSISPEIWRPPYSVSTGDHAGFDHRPTLPGDYLGCTPPTVPGIWNTSVHLGWIWSRARRYLSECAQNILKEPWRHDSTYAMVFSDFMDTENRIPICHRYDSVKFYERKVEELKTNRDYWAPWLKEQFTYHAIPLVLNHPFLYIVGAQHNSNLAIPNTFWRRSSELALLHSTWIVRIIDMILDKQVPLVDPFFAHIAAIAATVHLYYCCAADARLKHKSNTDFAKCRRFLKSFLRFSAACRILDRNLDKMTRIAAGSESMDVEDWLPSKIYLSIPLMWDILQFNCIENSGENPTAGLLGDSLAPSVAHEDTDENSILEIIVASSPEITINTADGGQDAPILSYRPTVPSTREQRTTVPNEQPVEQTDSLTLNTTPWLWADDSQFLNIGNISYHDSQPAIAENAAWWEVGNFSNTMF